MARIKVNWAKLDGLGKRTLENRDTFEAARTRLQELADELMNYWKGDDAENYHERITIFLDYLKGETEFMEKWSKYFGRASGNYKSGVEEGLKNIKQTNAIIDEATGNPKAMLVDEGMMEIMATDDGGAFTMAPESEKVHIDEEGRYISELPDQTEERTGHINGWVGSEPDAQIPENNGPSGHLDGRTVLGPTGSGQGPSGSSGLRSGQGSGGTTSRVQGNPGLEHGTAETVISGSASVDTQGHVLSPLPGNTGTSGHLSGWTVPGPTGSGQGPGGSALNQTPVYLDEPDAQIPENSGRDISYGEVRYPDGYSHINGEINPNGGNN